MSPQDPAEELRGYIAREIRRYGTTEAIRPAHRVKFFWPPHPVSYSYHVLASDWTGHATMEAYDESFDVMVARTPFGVFGRCETIWHEERGESEEAMLACLRATSEPLFVRQRLIAQTLERTGRATDGLEKMSPIDWLKLLYCPDRDVANEAHLHIERYSERGSLLSALRLILDDRSHPHRRSAQWCVLDLFEDLPSFAKGPQEEANAVASTSGLLMDAEDDYARTVYKAGVVLGGHLPHRSGGDALLSCLASPSRIGRRSAIHGLFHVVEWMPERRDEVVLRLKSHAAGETEPLLARFAASIAGDLQAGRPDHVLEPTFPDETNLV